MSKPRPPEPYRGQKRCPVCGNDLAGRGTPLSVEASLAAPEKKTFWQVVGLAKPSPQRLSYFVCGAECAATAKEDSNKYLIEVMTGANRSR